MGVGEFGRLTSWTVSSAPLAGVRIPDCRFESSTSLSELDVWDSERLGEGVGR